MINTIKKTLYLFLINKEHLKLRNPILYQIMFTLLKHVYNNIYCSYFPGQLSQISIKRQCDKIC